MQALQGERVEPEAEAEDLAGLNFTALLSVAQNRRYGSSEFYAYGKRISRVR